MYLTNVVEYDLRPGEGLQYVCSGKDFDGEADANWLCIECPSYYNKFSSPTTKIVQLAVGDINFDGKIDMDDYTLLASYTYEGPDADKYHWTPTPKQLKVMNCCTNTEKDLKEINTKDAEYLYRYIHDDPAIPDLGVVEYEVEAGDDFVREINNFLILDGHYDTLINIPYLDFVNDDWVIHEKFFNYLFNMAVHKYSDQDDIDYVQKLLKAVYPTLQYDRTIFQRGFYNDYVRELVRIYQWNQVNYTTGDLNKDNKIDEKDLEILRNYLDDIADYNEVVNYLMNPTLYPLTPEEIVRLDTNEDGIIDETDRFNIKNSIDTKYSPLMIERMDINKDGIINEDDYKLLQDEVEGITHNLSNLDITFNLGWLDVQTEKIIEDDINSNGAISEVSK